MPLERRYVAHRKHFAWHNAVARRKERDRARHTSTHSPAGPSETPPRAASSPAPLRRESTAMDDDPRPRRVLNNFGKGPTTGTRETFCCWNPIYKGCLHLDRDEECPFLMCLRCHKVLERHSAECMIWAPATFTEFPNMEVSAFCNSCNGNWFSIHNIYQEGGHAFSLECTRCNDVLSPALRNGVSDPEDPEVSIHFPAPSCGHAMGLAAAGV